MIATQLNSTQLNVELSWAELCRYKRGLTLCDPIWQVTPRSSEIWIPMKSYTRLFILLTSKWIKMRLAARLADLGRWMFEPVIAKWCVCNWHWQVHRQQQNVLPVPRLLRHRYQLHSKLNILQREPNAIRYMTKFHYYDRICDQVLSRKKLILPPCEMTAVVRQLHIVAFYWSQVCDFFPFKSWGVSGTYFSTRFS